MNIVMLRDFVSAALTLDPIWVVFAGLAFCWLVLLPQGHLRRRKVR